MEDSDFSDEFCRFIQSSIPSVEAAELLILLMNRAPQAAKVEAGESARYAETFKERGLLIAEADGGYCFQPTSPELAQLASTLLTAWRQRPVTLIRVIYALRDAKIKSFADAFRIRKS
jgi:hypothetical protein